MSYAHWYRIQRPYAALVDSVKRRYFFVNRNYKTLGNDKSGYEEYPFEDGQFFYFYSDCCQPWTRVRHQDTYDRKLNQFKTKYSGYERIYSQT